MAFITDHVNSLIDQWFPGKSLAEFSLSEQARLGFEASSLWTWPGGRGLPCFRHFTHLRKGVQSPEVSVQPFRQEEALAVFGYSR